jgi:amylosucrase
MQAHSFFLGGVPMLFYGDEVGYTNDYSYLQEKGKSYDNRWMHRPLIDWKKNERIEKEGTTEQIVFTSTKKLLSIRKKLAVVADYSNLTWLTPHNIHVASYLRNKDEQRLFCAFNFSSEAAYLTWYAFKENGNPPTELYDHWTEQILIVGEDHEFLVLPPYGFALLEG